MLWIVAKLLIEEEKLLASTENELVVAICTGQESVYEFHMGLRLTSTQGIFVHGSC
ncbi:MAG: hypothetical protein JWM43_2438 [Acidobacteriaceae bacterium]|nr:hypothetical protein [Acidobacteriaceae bacterium]